MNLNKVMKKILRNKQIYHKAYNAVSHNHIAVDRKNRLIYKNALLKNCKIVISGVNNRVEIQEEACLTNAIIKVHGNNNVINIGRHAGILDSGFYIEDDNNSISIGSRTTTSGLVNFSCAEGTKISVGEDCMFSANIEVRTSDAHSIIDKYGNRTNLSGDITIGDHCWVGNTVFVLKSAQIGSDCVVGAGSIVNGGVDCENGAVIAGNPAKIVKRDISWKRQRI